MHNLARFTYLLYQLTLRDLKARYKQTFLGALWVFGRPLIELGVFAVVFGAFFRAPSDGVPYPLFALSGVVLWSLVAGGLSRGTRSITAHAELVAQTPFPKATIPLAALGGAVFDGVLASALLGGLLIYDGRALALAALWVVPIAGLLVVIVAGLTLICCTLNVFYHDFGYLVDVGIRVWLLLTPVAYASSVVPDRYRVLYDLNPLVALFEGARSALLAGRAPELATLGYPLAVGGALLVIGAVLFRHAEPFFAESV
ncbi:MAG TPA: ABC transporter permease [Gemmatimonadales bacterium]|nr:ABC transporter permease [Gemmatimonadales bacterium]